MKLKNGDLYFYCTWVDSMAEGRGFVYKPNFLFLDGFFKKGMPEGKAKVKFLN